MKINLIKISLSLVLVYLMGACGKTDDGPYDLGTDYSSESGVSDGNGGQSQPGVITAGEWNDLDNWDFWNNLLTREEYKNMQSYWSLFHNNRISVEITTNGSQPVVNAYVQLKRAGTTIFSARTDNQGKAELWIDLLQENRDIDYSTLTLDINEGAKVIQTVKPHREGTNAITIPISTNPHKIEICWVVDATGSMGDELEYLKTELIDVLSRVEQANAESDIATAAVFYRDEGDDYVTKVSAFTPNYSNTINVIKAQRAEGGGDFPEAVHTALEKSVSELQWSTNARTRLLFLVLDAPPHYKQSVIQSLHTQIKKASDKGIKIIPVTASGIDKNTEFLMRFFSITTNGTYVFITNHSGVGNSHLEPSVGEYQVEFLNDLMVRLINKYAE
jgi:hypothetical protein